MWHELQNCGRDVYQAADAVKDATRDLHVRPLEGLEALHAHLERVEVRTDDREHEPSLAVRRGRLRIALRAARQRDRRTREDPALDVLHLAEDGRAGRLCGQGGRSQQAQCPGYGQPQGATDQMSQAHELLSFFLSVFHSTGRRMLHPFVTSRDKGYICESCSGCQDELKNVT